MKFAKKDITISNIIKKADGSDLMQTFSNYVFESSKQCIPIYFTKAKKSYPWFTKECRDIIHARKRAQRLCHRQPSRTNRLRYKEFCAQARRTVRQAKKQSWAEYVSKFNKFTNIKKTWDMVRKISGKNQSQPLKFIKTPQGDITSKQDIA